MSSALATCSECHAELQPGMLRCRACGARIKKGASAPVSAPELVSPAPASISLPVPVTQPTAGGTDFHLDSLLSAPTPAVAAKTAKSFTEQTPNPPVVASQETGRTPIPSPAPKVGGSQQQRNQSAASSKLAATPRPNASAILEVPTLPDAPEEAAGRISVQCGCTAKFRIKPELSGKRIKCPKCGQALTVPGPVESTQTTVSGRIARPALPAASDFNQLASAIAALPLQQSDPPELKERLSKGKLKKLSLAIEKKNGEGKPEAEQRRQKILELGATRDSRIVSLLEPLASDYWISVREGVAEALGELRDPAGVPMLIQMLGDEVPEVRRLAIVSLGKVGDARAVVALVDVALQDPMFRFTASESVIRMGVGAVPALLDLLQGDDPGRTLEAVTILGRIKDRSAAEPVANLLNHKFATIRAQAAEALGQIGEVKSANALIRSLADTDAAVRAQAAAALHRLGEKRATKALVKLLDDVDMDVQIRAATALGDLGDEESVSSLLPLLEHDDPNLRGAAADALGKLGSEAAAVPLTRLFEDADENVRLKAVSAFRRFKSNAATQPLLGLLSDSNFTIRQRAVDALGEIGNPIALDPLIAILRTDGAVEVRMAAAKALGLLRSAKALPVLEEALDDELTVRCRAIAALGDIGDASSLPALLAMLRDVTPEVRYHASQSLAEIGHQNSRKSLEELLGDENSMVRRGAAKALIKLGDPRGESLLEQASKPIAQKTQIQWSALLPDWAYNLTNPGGNATLVLGGIAGVVLLGLAGWFGSGIIGGLFSSPAVIISRGNVSSIAFSPEGTNLAVGRSRGLLEIWDIPKKQVLKSVPYPLELAQITGVAYAPDGKSLLAFAGKSVFKYQDGQFQPATALPADLMFLSAAPGESAGISFSKDGTAFVWDLSTAGVKSTFKIEAAAPVSFAASPDANRFAISTEKNTILLVDAEKGAVHGEVATPKRKAIHLLFASDSKHVIASLSDGALAVVDFDTKRIVQEVPGAKLNRSGSDRIVSLPKADMKFLSVGDGRFIVLKAPELSVENEVSDVPFFSAEVVAASADGASLAGGSREDSPVGILQISNGTISAILDQN